jgi:DNA primase
MAKKLRYKSFVNRIDIDAVEDALGFEPIEQTGTEDRGYCFDLFGLHSHGDTTGKFSINREKKIYGCWVCGGGSLLSLVMELKGMDGEDATHWLYQFTEGEETEEETTSRLKGLLNKSESKEAPTLPFFNEHVLDRFEKDHPYFEDRGISPMTREVYQLRYNPKSMKRAPKNKDDDDYVGPAIVFPHFWQGRLVGWQSRFLEDDRPVWCKKYNNTHDFPKDETLYNYDRALNSQMMPIVVESVPTALFLESCGYPSICTFGASVTGKQMQLLRTFQQGLILAFDNDKAGYRAMDEITRYLSRYIPIWHMPYVGGEGADLGDLAPHHELVDDHVSQITEPLESKLHG